MHSDAPNDAPDNFAEALAMVARLPLSDAERAEAVRRLLTTQEVHNNKKGDNHD